MHRFLLSRPLAVLVATTLAFSASAQAVFQIGGILRAAVLAQMPTSDYTDSPGGVDEGVHPQVQRVGRGGLWDDLSLASFRDAAKIEAGLLSPRTPPVGTTDAGDTGDNQALVGLTSALSRSQEITTDQAGASADDRLCYIWYPPGTVDPGTGCNHAGGPGTGTNPGPGTPPGGGPTDPPLPPALIPGGPGGGEGNNWEGSGPGGGSTMAPGIVNTQTGNRLTTMPVVGWKTKGGLPFGFTLYHNAQENVDLGWGQNWRSNFDMRVLYTGNAVNGNRDYLTVVYPTGKRLPFARQQFGGQPTWGPTFYPPKGYHDIVFSASGGGFTLRTADQKVYAFDGTGRLTSETDRHNNRITLTYETFHLKRATDASGRSLTFTWGNIGSPSSNNNEFNLHGFLSMTGPSGRTWTFNHATSPAGTGVGGDGHTLYLRGVLPPAENDGRAYATPSFVYSASGAILAELNGGVGYTCAYDQGLRLTRFTDGAGNATTYAYNATNTVRTNPDGGTQTDFYDTGLLRSEQDEAGFSRTYTYDDDYNVVQLLDERGNVQRYEYDAFGNRTSSQDPRQYAAGVKTTTTYNSYNDVVTGTDTRGAKTTLNRDPGNGVVLSVTDPTNSVVVANTYAPTGALTGTSAEDATTTADYDANGNPHSVTGPNGTVTLTYLDGRFPDKPTSWTDALGRITGVDYDNAGRPVQVTRGDGATTLLQYDSVGRVLRATDWLGHATQYAYDAGGRRVSKTNAQGFTERYTYDVCNRVKTIADGRGKLRTYLYTRRGEVTVLILPDGANERYQYDAGGNQTTRTNAAYQTTRYAYDAADNLVSVAYPSGPGVTYAYDLDGRTVTMTDATGVSTWTYDLAGRTASLMTPQGTQTYAYDRWGRRTSLGQGGGNVTTTTYTAEKPTGLLKLPENEATAWSYDGVGRLAAQTLPNGAVTTYGYDALDRVSAIAHKRANGSTISSETYVYDAGGNLTSKTVDGVTTTYAYDAIDQLIRETVPGTEILYGYDGNGNRLKKITNGEVEDYEYDDGDKLLARHSPGVAYTYAYDACGRTRAVTGPLGTTNLTYDYEDRLTGVNGPTGGASYAYNGADARVSKAGSSGPRTYRRDGVGVTDPVLSDGVGTMVPGVSERTNGATKFSHLDRLGTNAKTTDAGGAVVDSRRYDAFGLPISVTNPTNSEKGFASAFGVQEDPETGLKLMGHRYYDPGSGRFITRDPSQDGKNWYRYADNNPLKAVDADGLKRIVVVRGDLGGPGGDPDISGCVNHIIDGIRDANPDDEVIVVDSAEEAYKLLGMNPQESDCLFWLGHSDCGQNSGNGLFCSGEPLSPFTLSAARHGVGLACIKLIGCHTLSDPAYAAAWARLAGGNLWGTYYSLAMNLVSHGIGIPGYSVLSKYQKGRKRVGYGMKKPKRTVKIGGGSH